MNNTVLITGNRKGIGLFLTQYFLDQGKNVIGCSRSKSNLQHKNYIHFLGDVSNEKDVLKIVREGYKKFGSIDILINNAGKASLNHSLLTPSKVVEDLFKTNFNGSFFFSKACAKYMIKKNMVES